MRAAPLDLLAGWRAARAAGLIPGVPGAAAPPGTAETPQKTADLPGFPGLPGDPGTNGTDRAATPDLAATVPPVPVAMPDQEDWSAVDAWLHGAPDHHVQPKESRR